MVIVKAGVEPSASQAAELLAIAMRELSPAEQVVITMQAEALKRTVNRPVCRMSPPELEQRERFERLQRENRIWWQVR